MRLIDADALKHEICNILMCGEHEQFYAIVSEVAKVLIAAPTVDPARHARWVDVEILDVDDKGISYTMTWFECSACGRRVFFKFQKSNHCPNCGARMDAEEEKDG